MNRRRLLQALGAGGLLLPSLGAVGGAPRAKRLVSFVTNHGVVYDRWRIREGRPEDRDFELDLGSLAPASWSPILAPLRPFASSLLVLDGLANGCGVVSPLKEHERGCASVLTGRMPVLSGSLTISDGPSLDQVLARTRATPFRSLEYAVGGWSVNFDGRGQPLPFEEDPVAAWTRLFPEGSGGTPTEADRIAAWRASVLDLAAGRHDALARRMPAEDRAKLEQHRDLLRDLQARVGAPPELACSAPERPVLTLPWDAAGYPAERFGAFAGLAAAALSCGLTDVVTLRLDDVNPATIGAPPGDLHNDYAHQASTDPASGEVMTDYHVFLAQQLAGLLAALAAVPDGEGTLLDSTVVVWTNEVATGEHGFANLPVVLAGGAGTLRTGRYVRWAPIAALEGTAGEVPVGPPHNRLLTTLGLATGLDLDAFGARSLPTTGGGTLDCTGTLDRVLT